MYSLSSFRGDDWSFGSSSSSLSETAGSTACVFFPFLSFHFPLPPFVFFFCSDLGSTTGAERTSLPSCDPSLGFLVGRLKPESGSVSVAIEVSSFFFRFLMLDVEDGSERAWGANLDDAGTPADVLCANKDGDPRGGRCSRIRRKVLDIPDSAETIESRFA